MDDRHSDLGLWTSIIGTISGMQTDEEWLLRSRRGRSFGASFGGYEIRAKVDTVKRVDSSVGELAPRPLEDKVHETADCRAGYGEPCFLGWKYDASG